MKKLKCEWCRKELKNHYYDALVCYDGEAYAMSFCCENHARDKAWSGVKTQKMKVRKPATLECANCEKFFVDAEYDGLTPFCQKCLRKGTRKVVK